VGSEKEIDRAPGPPRREVVTHWEKEATSMIRYSAFVLTAFVLSSSPAWCQVNGVNLDGGFVYLTKAGSLHIGSGVFESDTGHAVRGRVRLGFGWLAVGADVQSSSQKLGATTTATAPSSLSATYVGLNGTVHPITLLGFTPYGEAGIGKLFFSDERIDAGGGVKAVSYGLGLRMGLLPRLHLDGSFRIQRQGGLHASGVTDEFKYDPKLFSLMLSLRL
jgi:hypothetical protein